MKEMKLESADEDIRPLPPSRFEGVVSPRQYHEFARSVTAAQRLLAGRTFWNVNSTARGGGVAEMLRPLIGYARGAGIDARWLVVNGSPEFFRVTKRIHNQLHGSPGDGGSLDGEATKTYDEWLSSAAQELAPLIRPGDLVLLHDPQPAGLVPHVRRLGAYAIWRCHVGVDRPNAIVRRAWNFLRPYLEPADAYVFSRAVFVWDGLDRRRVWVIPPSIDAFSAKNRDLDGDQVDAILTAAGVLEGGAGADASYPAEAGGEAEIKHRAQMVETSRATVDDRLVVQVSRWDRLKDPVGAVRAFAEHIATGTPAHFLLAGPAAQAIQDDPEGLGVLRETIRAWEALEPDRQKRIHLATLPMEDTEENAIIVNALQRKSALVTQKSLAEGFGLTVAEAMWKARPVVASRVGGIQDQVEDGRSGILVDDPRDLAAFGAAVRLLLRNPERAEAMGAAARERVREHFLAPRHLMQYLDLVARLLEGADRVAQEG